VELAPPPILMLLFLVLAGKLDASSNPDGGGHLLHQDGPVRQLQPGRPPPALHVELALRRRGLSPNRDAIVRRTITGRTWTEARRHVVGRRSGGARPNRGAPEGGRTRRGRAEERRDAGLAPSGGSEIGRRRE